MFNQPAPVAALPSPLEVPLHTPGSASAAPSRRSSLEGGAANMSFGIADVVDVVASVLARTASAAASAPAPVLAAPASSTTSPALVAVSPSPLPNLPSPPTTAPLPPPSRSAGLRGARVTFAAVRRTASALTSGRPRAGDFEMVDLGPRAVPSAPGQCCQLKRLSHTHAHVNLAVVDSLRIRIKDYFHTCFLL